MSAAKTVNLGVSSPYRRGYSKLEEIRFVSDLSSLGVESVLESESTADPSERARKLKAAVNLETSDLTGSGSKAAIFGSPRRPTGDNPTLVSEETNLDNR